MQDQDQIDFDAGFNSVAESPEYVIPEKDNDDAPDEIVEQEEYGREEPEQRVDETDWQVKFRELEQKTNSWNGRLSAEAKAKADLAEQNANLARELSELKSKLEPKSAIELDPEFEESWPDVANVIKSQELKRTEMFDARLASEAEKIRSEFKDSIAPIREANEKAHIANHFKQISDKHPDLEAIVRSNDLEAWVDKHPRYIADSLRQVIDHGAADDVIDMLNRFKSERKAVVEKQKDTREKKLNDAMAVRSRPGEPTQSTASDPNDFSAGWLLAKNSRR